MVTDLTTIAHSTLAEYLVHLKIWMFSTGDKLVNSPQQTFSCPKRTIDILGKSVRYVQT